jgi:hypothetical protein
MDSWIHVLAEAQHLDWSASVPLALSAKREHFPSGLRINSPTFKEGAVIFEISNLKFENCLYFLL